MTTGMIDVTIAAGTAAPLAEALDTALDTVLDVPLAASVFGAADAPPVLFLHGIGNARDTWYDWAQQLAPHFRVLALDFRGHGHSSRAARYHLADYVRDASAALTFLGAPTLVVGHSLGGLVAGRLAQLGHPLVERTLLVDPAWFFGVPDEFARTVYPRRFTLLRDTIDRLRSARASLAEWTYTVGSAPHPWGGVFADHTPARLIAAHASALQRQDVTCWDTPVGDAFGGFGVLDPFLRPATVLHADERYGAALLPDQAQRLAAANSLVSLQFYEGSDHFPHRSMRFAERFSAELERFVRGA